MIAFALGGAMAPQRRLGPTSLAAAVVVDVHCGVAGVALHDPVDELLERGLLPFAVVGPDRVVDRFAVNDLCPAEEVFEAVVESPRVRLDVEENIERRWLRECGEPLTRDIVTGWNQLVPEDMVSAIAELERGLVTKPLEDARWKLRDRRVLWQFRELLERVDTGLDQPPPVRPCDVGDKGEVVVRPAAVNAHRPP